MNILAQVLNKKEYLTKEEFEELMSLSSDISSLQSLANTMIKTFEDETNNPIQKDKTV